MNHSSRHSSPPASPHPSEEQLVGYAFGDTDDEATLHLAACAECREEVEALRSTLEEMNHALVAEPGPDYEASAWARLAPQLAPKPAPQLRVAWRRRPVWGAVAALMVASLGGAFWLGRSWPRPHPSAATVAVAAGNPRQVLLVVVGDHLDHAQMVLLELQHAPADVPVNIAQEQAWARDLIASNRLYEQSAQMAGNASVANLLATLEPVLLQIAHSPDQPDPKQLAALQSQIRATQILFKLRVVNAQLQQQIQPAISE